MSELDPLSLDHESTQKSKKSSVSSTSTTIPVTFIGEPESTNIHENVIWHVKMLQRRFFTNVCKAD